jgi:hypothetical protein
MTTTIVKLTLKLVLLILSFLITQFASAQDWLNLEQLPDKEFTCIKVISGQIYALSENKLYRSADGETWEEETITPNIITPISLEFFNNTIYIGTFFNGVYEKSLSPNSNWNQYLDGVAVSSFAIHNNELYLSTFGVGVYKKVGGIWQNFNYNIPTFSYNVNKLLSINNTLHAFAGGNGTFYTFNSTTQSWQYHYFFGNISPGFISDDAIRTSNNVIYVGRGNNLLRSNNQGQTWSLDAIGLLNGSSRLLYEGANSVYVLSLIFNDNNAVNYTRIQKRATHLPILSSWAGSNELLEFYTYGICEFGNQIFLATDSGIYRKTDNSLVTEIPTKSEFKLFPVPSHSNEIHFTSDTVIDEVKIYDTQGRLVYRNQFNNKNGTINLSQKGLFIATLSDSNGAKWSAKIIMN